LFDRVDRERKGCAGGGPGRWVLVLRHWGLAQGLSCRWRISDDDDVTKCARDLIPWTLSGREAGEGMNMRV
jgi:hypothetical protein